MTLIPPCKSRTALFDGDWPVPLPQPHWHLSLHGTWEFNPEGDASKGPCGDEIQFACELSPGDGNFTFP